MSDFNAAHDGAVGPQGGAALHQGFLELPHPRDLAPDAGAALHDHHLRLDRRGEHRQRDADEVVEVALRLVYPEPRAERRGGELPRAGLSVGARDRDDGSRELVAAQPGEPAERREGVVHLEPVEPGPARRAQPRDHAAHAGEPRVAKVVVRVEALALEGDEQLPFLHGARVG